MGTKKIKGLVQRGRNYELLVAGSKIIQIIYTGDVGLQFDDECGTRITISRDFTLVRFGKTEKIDPLQRQTLIAILDLLWAEAAKAVIEDWGLLEIAFTNKVSLLVEPNGFECWEVRDRSGLHVLPVSGLTIWGRR